MSGDFEIKELTLSLKSERKKLETFLNANALRLSELDYYLAAFDAEDNIVAGAGIQGCTIKCVAVGEAARETGLTNALISGIQSYAFRNGFEHTMLYTKPENQSIFSSLGYNVIGRADKAILMDSQTKRLDKYKEYLTNNAMSGVSGAIVMNCNPFTLGHLYLIEQAAKQVDTLFIIPVVEERSDFSTAARIEMIKLGTRHITNVQVLDGSIYTISSVTFPTYFLKELSDASRTYMQLDADVFAAHIAPALRVDVRFVGSEPSDMMTNNYNVILKESLSKHNIEVVEVQRFEKNGRVVSASFVRNCLKHLKIAEAMSMVPKTTWPCLIAHLAANAIETELKLTPKPGLVDMHDSGAHRDMDYELMYGSIHAIKPYFERIAIEVYTSQNVDLYRIRQIGIEAEKAMLECTYGVNTYKGALFAMSVVIVAYTNLLKSESPIDCSQLREAIVEIASKLSPAQDTHGASVIGKNVKGALQMAQTGYSDLFDDWMPYLAKMRHNPDAYLLLLLHIMSRLDDTNILYRGGENASQWVKDRAVQLLKSFSVAEVEQLNREFISRNLSPGGAADMFSLTIFIDALLNTNIEQLN